MSFLRGMCRGLNWGFGLCFLYLRNVKGFGWNHKRVYRIYCELELNMRIKPKKRIKREKPEPLAQPIDPRKSLLLAGNDKERFAVYVKKNILVMTLLVLTFVVNAFDSHRAILGADKGDAHFYPKATSSIHDTAVSRLYTAMSSHFSEAIVLVPSRAIIDVAFFSKTYNGLVKIEPYDPSISYRCEIALQAFERHLLPFVPAIRFEKNNKDLNEVHYLFLLKDKPSCNLRPKKILQLGTHNSIYFVAQDCLEMTAACREEARRIGYTLGEGYLSAPDS